MKRSGCARRLGKRGTCIDLTLLLAACLEYVEIYAVIFLLNDHAFPGYWRSQESHELLGQISLAASVPVAEATAVPSAAHEVYTDVWMFGRSRFPDVTALVNQGHVVPLESVSLTSRGVSGRLSRRARAICGANGSFIRCSTC